MDIARAAGVIGLAYLLGAVPFGFILVMWRTGKDIRDVQSGRTGGTNAMRAAGFPVGLTTFVLDVLKGFFAVSLAEIILPGNVWVAALAPVAAVIGHNYSVSLIHVDNDGKLSFGGGAGGATVMGGAMGLWPPAEVEFIQQGDRVYLRKKKGAGARGGKLVGALKGKSSVKMSTDEILALTRGK